jgi:hypothetical protein
MTFHTHSSDNEACLPLYPYHEQLPCELQKSYGVPPGAISGAIGTATGLTPTFANIAA